MVDRLQLLGPRLLSDASACKGVVIVADVATSGHSGFAESSPAADCECATLDRNFSIEQYMQDDGITPQQDNGAVKRKISLLNRYVQSICGLYSRVARQLKVDRSYVSRVARGERRSPQVERALSTEFSRVTDENEHEIAG